MTVIAGCGSEIPQSPISDESITPAITGHRDHSTHVPPGNSPGYGSGSIDVMVTRPIGGETFGYKERVTWTATHPDPDPLLTALLSIDIHYSGDGGFTWETAAAGEDNDGIYIWDVRGIPAGENYLLRATATDTAGVSGVGISEEPFSITDRILITDKTGVRWDITHAVEAYDMQPENWRQGIGPYAIMPINDPVVTAPGDPGYPAGTDSFLVVGVDLPGGETRAYPIPVIYYREVVNDRIGEFAFAAVY